MKITERNELPDFFEFGPYRFDVRDQLLFKNGEEIHLTPKVAEILFVLLKQHGHLVEKEELMNEVWQDAIVEENNLTRNISTLRKILHVEPEEGEYIETIPRRGYRFITAVKEVHESSPGTEIERIEPVGPPPTIPETNTQYAAILATEATGKAESAHQNHSREKRAGFFRFTKPRSLLNTLLLVIIAILLFWQVRALYQIPGGSKPRQVVETFPKLQLNKHAAKGMPIKAELSPDGKYIAYAASDESGWQSLYFGQVNTNSAKRLVPPIKTEYQGLSFAPNGSHLYFTRREQNQNTVLYRLAVFSDEAPQQLAALGATGPVELSPDGSRIAFIREFVGEGTSALITANIDGSAERKLFERKLPDFFPLTGSPSWSPDGQSIVCVIGSLFNGFRYQVASIQLNSEQSKPESALTVNQTRWPWIYQVAWSPSGRELFLLADEQPGGFRDQLWLMTWPDGEVRRITNDLNDYHGISVAADSNALVTVQSNQISDLWIVPQQVSGRSQRISPFNDRREGLRGLDWTPDGILIFTSLENGREQIWSMHADGSQRCDLTLSESGNSNNYSPSISPDGKHVVFVSDRQGKTQIWRMNIDGSQSLSLTEGHDDLDPQVSSDGQWVIYSSAKSGSRALWKVPLAGGTETQVSDLPAEAPVSSPTSGLIACIWRDAGKNSQRKLTVIEPESRQPPRSYALPEGATWIRWLPNGKALSYSLTQNGLANVWGQPLTGKPPMQLTDLSFENVTSFAWSRDGKWLALTRVQEIRSVVFINGLK